MSMAPLLVCLDIQRVFVRDGPMLAPNAGNALLQCGRLLQAARERRWEIAHCYLRRAGGPFSVIGQDARPVEGFEPRPREMVFERRTLSAYGHGAFRSLMERADGAVVIAGLSASITFVATAFDAFDNGDSFLIAANAFAGQDGRESTAEVHEAVARDIAAHLGFVSGSAAAGQAALLTST